MTLNQRLEQAGQVAKWTGERSMFQAIGTASAESSGNSKQKATLHLEFSRRELGTP